MARESLVGSIAVLVRCPPADGHALGPVEYCFRFEWKAPHLVEGVQRHGSYDVRHVCAIEVLAAFLVESQLAVRAHMQYLCLLQS